jgi:hypothetical protein
MSIVNGFVGFLLLASGSQLYWFFSAVVSFLIGEFVAVRFFNVAPGTDLIMIGMGAAVIGVLLTITARKLTLILVGFMAGFLAASVLPGLFNWHPGFNEWFLLIAAGVAGGLLVYFAYAYAVILLSALIGAQMLALAVHLGGVNPQVLFLAVLTLGIGVQLLLAQYASPSIEK